MCRVMCDPNGLFCCGDPCQTIARGIVFRFADICTLFHHESQRRKVPAACTLLASAIASPVSALLVISCCRTCHLDNGLPTRAADPAVHRTQHLRTWQMLCTLLALRCG